MSKPSKDKGWIKAKFQIFVSILLNSVLLHSRIVATKLTMRHLLAPIHILQESICKRDQLFPQASEVNLRGLLCKQNLHQYFT